MSGLLNWRRLARSIACSAAAVAMSTAAAFAQSGEPIKIGFSMSLTGPLAANGMMSLVAMKIWEEDVNAAGGLLGRNRATGALGTGVLQRGGTKQTADLIGAKRRFCSLHCTY